MIYSTCRPRVIYSNGVCHARILSTDDLTRVPRGIRTAIVRRDIPSSLRVRTRHAVRFNYGGTWERKISSSASRVLESFGERRVFVRYRLRTSGNTSPHEQNAKFLIIRLNRRRIFTRSSVRPFPRHHNNRLCFVRILVVLRLGRPGDRLKSNHPSRST